jgi:hypothetical protein
VQILGAVIVLLSIAVARTARRPLPSAPSPAA